eukprot:CAMPEP_0202907242 /NCGR_PEP_ID=MMETSP1392-20130828/41833_1 /ASSEMBLY_ACC=CAM_ASM_000868 /TAXON_ID=225041 /ORGANISM="Chlamydomonas chlamydogama, Strain SAG 11-48b" /LENGTH=41 /DNA_ID= /DNA_START= /DNA_END= /DNA_ORIENTATION=
MTVKVPGSSSHNQSSIHACPGCSVEQACNHANCEWPWEFPA